MNTWEYRLYDQPSDMQRLNELGKEGWEAFAVEANRMWLKRRLDQKQAENMLLEANKAITKE